MNTTEMKRYKSTEWNFTLDIPKRWHAFPPVSSNSPAEVIRFASKEEGNHLVIIFRWARDPKKSLQEGCEHVQQILTGKGFANFSTIETTIGTRAALMKEFDRPGGRRHLELPAVFSCGGNAPLRSRLRHEQQRWYVQTLRPHGKKF